MASQGVPEALAELVDLFRVRPQPQNVLNAAYDTFQKLMGRPPRPEEQRILIYCLNFDVEIDVDTAIDVVTSYLQFRYPDLIKKT